MKGNVWLNIKVILMLIGIVLITMFATLNSNKVNVNFGLATVQISQAIVVLISALAGAIIMYLINLINIIRQKKMERDISLAIKQKERRKKKEQETVSPAVEDIEEPQLDDVAVAELTVPEIAIPELEK